ncbi:hypothetical protein [Clostridium neonatale]|uniref:hypothetical protein n=1 Tax=Clostridium neonatale TaxID=137838 RepID=UPI00291B70AF|nr:hypothetical protein CNEO3_30134 [Clostridium neonatale]CAI3617545.1 hypothetical protein CNEO4_250083 [Clostridium neonatale]
MVNINLPCGVGDIIYYITAWNKQSLQPKNKEEIVRIEILKDEIIFHTRYRKFLLSKYEKTWFSDKDKYEKESCIVRELYIKEQELRTRVSM